MYTLKKSLGQHFLHDEQVCQKIVASASLPPSTQLLEVGPGGGALSKYLIQVPDITYLAVEIDREKADYLNRVYPSMQGKIMCTDILTVPMPFESRFNVIGNFPYNISSPIMFRILEWEPFVGEVVGMFQKEVAVRISGKPGSKDYGILSVLMQAFFKTTYLFDVAEGCFTPPPKVKSGVVKFENLGNPHGIADKRKFMIVVKAAFNQRRKTLRNALKSILPLNAADHPLLNMRAEQLSVAEFVVLYKIFLNEPTDS
jgi:16S rRNA (adenine1518-N6/adenine1519-N6)-dimethyltransferase